MKHTKATQKNGKLPNKAERKADYKERNNRKTARNLKRIYC